MVFFNGEGPRLHHLAFHTPEIANVIHGADAMASLGLAGAMDRAPGRHGIGNAFFVYFRDPDGHRVETFTSHYSVIDIDHEPTRWDLSIPGDRKSGAFPHRRNGLRGDRVRRRFRQSAIARCPSDNARRLSQGLLSGMKLGTRYVDGREAAIVMGSDGLARDLAQVAEFAGKGRIGSMLELVQAADRDKDLLNALDADAAPGFAVDQIDWAPPIPDPSMILNVPFNNKELMKRAHRDPGVPNFFLKPPSCLQGHTKPIVVDPDWGAVIPEPEVCAVIGKRAKRISDEDALDHIFGYLIHNDVTSHGLKFQLDSIAVSYDADMARPEFFQWRNRRGEDDTDAYFVYHTRSKGTDTFGPMGPWITTADEILDPDDLNVVGALNGEEFTRDRTSNYRFKIERCISEASRYFTLRPGDLLSFGTTGKGNEKFPRGRKSVLIGETQGEVSIEIAPLGRLENPIRPRKGGA